MTRSIVTGGTGFIGSNLALKLEELGHEVSVWDRSLSTRDASLKGFTGQTLLLDVSQPFSFEKQGKCDFIFHQAAITDPRHSDDKETLEKNLNGFRNVVEYARWSSARLIYASTAGLYGNGPIPMREDQPVEILTAYGKSKWMMDQMAETLQASLPIVGLRYFNVFGPRESHKGRPASMIFHLRNQMMAGKNPRLFKFGEHKRDFLYVKDAVSANLLAMNANGGVYNVGTGVGTSFNELVEILNKILGTELPPEYFDMPFDSRTYQHHTVADIAFAKQKLKLKIEWPLERAIRDYYTWLNNPV